MATSLLVLLDDITAMTNVAAGKTAGVLGDDLALNAQQVAEVRPERELPVVWAVAKGSWRNKLILVPAALLISALAAWAIMPLLMLGGLFLCYESFEKVFHKLLGGALGVIAGGLVVGAMALISKLRGKRGRGRAAWGGAISCRG